MPTSSATLSAVPNQSIANSLTGAGTASMTRSPTSSTGERNADDAADTSSATPSATSAVTSPARRRVRCLLVDPVRSQGTFGADGAADGRVAPQRRGSARQMADRPIRGWFGAEPGTWRTGRPTRSVTSSIRCTPSVDCVLWSAVPGTATATPQQQLLARVARGDEAGLLRAVRPDRSTGARHGPAGRARPGDVRGGHPGGHGRAVAPGAALRRIPRVGHHMGRDRGTPTRRGPRPGDRSRRATATSVTSTAPPGPPTTRSPSWSRTASSASG